MHLVWRRHGSFPDFDSEFLDVDNDCLPLGYRFLLAQIDHDKLPGVRHKQLHFDESTVDKALIFGEVLDFNYGIFPVQLDDMNVTLAFLAHVRHEHTVFLEDQHTLYLI